MERDYKLTGAVNEGLYHPKDPLLKSHLLLCCRLPSVDPSHLPYLSKPTITKQLNIKSKTFKETIKWPCIVKEKETSYFLQNPKPKRNQMREVRVCVHEVAEHQPCGCLCLSIGDSESDLLEYEFG